METAHLKPSQFNVTVNDYPEKTKHLLYNTQTQSLVSVDDEALELLSNPVMATDAESQGFVEALSSHGFLVPKEWNEGERYLKSLSATTQSKGGELSVTLLTNLQRCPLACVYCFQKGAHVGGKLDADNLDQALAFIKKQSLKLGVERLWISYYGSEPLSNPKAIFESATELQQFCKTHNIAFRFGMVTSGVLLTKERVEAFVPLGFIHAQITIDGNKETHDATRPFQSGKGTYDLIMKNLEAYAGLIQTDVLCVLAEERIQGIYQLIDTLAEKGLAERHVRMLFSPESADYSEETLLALPNLYVDSGTMLRAKEKQIVVEIAKLAIYANERGLYDRLLPESTWCAMQRHDERHLVIEPDGTLRTCPTMIGRDEKYKAGHIDTGVGGIDTVIKEEYTRTQQCLECVYLPICADCRVDALQKKGDILAPDSREEEFDLIVPDLIKAHFRARQRDAKATAKK
jgi:uncharacterized protein